MNEDEPTTLSHVVGMDGDIDVKIEKYEIGEKFYAVYTNKSGGGTVENILGNVDFHDEYNRLIVLRILQTAQKIYDENREQENVAVERYKTTEIEKIPDCSRPC